MCLAELQALLGNCEQKLKSPFPSLLSCSRERAENHSLHEVACGVVAAVVEFGGVCAPQERCLQDTVVEATEILWVEHNMPETWSRQAALVSQLVILAGALKQHRNCREYFGMARLRLKVLWPICEAGSKSH